MSSSPRRSATAIILYSNSGDVFPIVPSKSASFLEGYNRLKSSARFVPDTARKDILKNPNYRTCFAVALACHLALHSAKRTPFTIIDWASLKEGQITVALLNQFDVVYMIHGDASDHFFDGCDGTTCPHELKRIESVLSKTKARVVTPPSFQKFLLHKYKYYQVLQNAGIPVVPFFRLDPSKVVSASDASKVIDKVSSDKEWKGMIVKPSYGAYSREIGVYKDVSHSTTGDRFLTKMKRMAAQGYPPVTIQRFVKSFGKQYEVRTYWIEEKYQYSIATLSEKVGSSKDTLTITRYEMFESEGGSLSDGILRKLKLLARCVFLALPKYGRGPFPFLRIDFGCCLRDDGSCFSYFVNEVETFWCNMMLDLANVPSLVHASKLSKALLRFHSKNPNGGYRRLRPKKVDLSQKVRKITGCTTSDRS